MNFVHGYDSYRKEHLGRPLCLAIGMFDGFHLGHQEVINHALREAQGANDNSIAAAFTFNVHPASIVRPESSPRLIYPLPRKIACLESSGISHACVVDFNKNLCQLPAESFIDSLTTAFPSLKCICVGRDFGFGHRRAGNVGLLHQLSSKYGYTVHEVPARTFMDKKISSTIIREMISGGRLDEASSMLGRPYSLSGVVVRGRQLGRTLGFPTANLDTSGLCMPPNGVYAGFAHCQGQSIKAVMNIGNRPTISQNGNSSPTAEAHLIDFSGDIYDSMLDFYPVQHIRDECRFDSIDDLKEQIASDLQQSMEILDNTESADFC
jgi:riboflavin kinase/FMN adenylyltransferase